MHSLGSYIPGNSLVHQLDPRVKLVSLLALSVVIFRSDLTAALTLSILLACVICLARISLSQVLKSLRPVAVFFLFIFFLHVFFTPGREIFRFPGINLSVTFEGLATGSLLTGKFVLLVISAYALTATTMPSELVGGMERLLRPLNVLGFNSHGAAMMVSLALRFVPTLIGEYERTKIAQAARGMDFGKGGLVGRIRKISSLAVPLTINSFLRAEEIALAMESRGYSGGRRTYLRELRLQAADYGAMALVLAFAIFIQILP